MTIIKSAPKHERVSELRLNEAAQPAMSFGTIFRGRRKVSL